MFIFLVLLCDIAAVVVAAFTPFCFVVAFAITVAGSFLFAVAVAMFAFIIAAEAVVQAPVVNCSYVLLLFCGCCC